MEISSKIIWTATMFFEIINCGIVERLRQNKIWETPNKEIESKFASVIESEIVRIRITNDKIEKYAQNLYKEPCYLHCCDLSQETVHKANLQQICAHLSLKLGAVAQGYWESLAIHEGYFCILVYPAMDTSAVFYIQALLPPSLGKHLYSIVANKLMVDTIMAYYQRVDWQDTVALCFRNMRQDSCVEFVKYSNDQLILDQMISTSMWNLYSKLPCSLMRRLKICR